MVRFAIGRYLYFLLLFSILAANDPLKIVIKNPGLLILEASLDSVWIEELDGNEWIRTHPSLARLSREGKPEIPYLHTLLQGIPASANLQVFFGPTEYIPLFNPLINSVE